MTRFVARRCAQVILVLLAASLLLFLALRVIPGDPAERELGRKATPATLAAKRHELGVDRPLVRQYLDWVGGALHGDLGTSFTDGRPVAPLVFKGVQITLQLALAALVFAVILALPLGLAAALRPGGKVDAAVTAVAVTAASVPQFVWAMGLILVVALGLHALPASGYVPWGEDPARALQSLVLPTIALGLPSIGILARVVRVALLDAFDEPYFRFSRSKGISRRRLYLVHGLKRAAVPVVTVAGTELVAILAGTLVVETIFALPGMGKLTIDAFFQRDYAVIQATALVFTVLVVVSSMLADAGVAVLDPRIRGQVRLA